jgi:hypothetical protein
MSRSSAPEVAIAEPATAADYNDRRGAATEYTDQVGPRTTRITRIADDAELVVGEGGRFVEEAAALAILSSASDGPP